MYKSNLIAENKIITISDSFYGKSKNKIAVAFFPNSHGCRPNIPKESIEIYRSIGTKLVKR